MSNLCEQPNSRAVNEWLVHNSRVGRSLVYLTNKSSDMRSCVLRKKADLRKLIMLILHLAYPMDLG